MIHRCTPYALLVSSIMIVAGISNAGAQTWPAKPVRVVVPYPAGGLPDTMTRLVATRLTETLKQQFIIDNRPRHPDEIEAWMASLLR